MCRRQAPPMEGRGEVEIVGTAHVSERSAEEVQCAIEEHDPDVVAVELDSARYESLRERDEDVGYGADMSAAIEEAEARDVPVALIDRDITVTLKRLWSEMTLVERLKMAGALVAGAFGLGTASVDELEEAIEEGSVDEHVEDLRDFSPGSARTLIDERDAYMASRLLDLAEEGDVVAVVGAGHEAGIESHLDSPEEIPEVPAYPGSVEADADVLEKEDEVLVVVDLPGCREDDVEVLFEDGVVEVEATRERGLKPGFRRVGRTDGGRLEASVEVSGEVDADEATASYDDGVLEVRLPRPL